ncbi:MAG: hypothetical protein ACK4QL_05160 [Pseudanabaenaceae cyanobacterium]
MPKTRILHSNQPLTFSNYFEMNCDPEDILQELGFGLQRIYADFPRATVAEVELVQLKSTLERRLPYVKLQGRRPQAFLLIIEAKNADLARGFTQLAVELIGLAKWLK